MSSPVVIIGSGFAAYQLVKTLRRRSENLPIQIITASDGDEYNKPDLSHVFSRGQSAVELVTTTADEFARQNKVEILTNTRVEEINAEQRFVTAGGQRYPYSKLVLATGARAFIPPLFGDAVGEVITLNSLQEYSESQQRIADSESLVIMGGGLIGTELAMDLAASGKNVHIVEPGDQLIASVMPDFVSTGLEKQLRRDGLKIDKLNAVTAINRKGESLEVSTRNGVSYQADSVISAAGLVPNTELANHAGLRVNRGIVVNEQLKTSVEGIYAIGDCAEINGRVMAFLQPIVLSANTLANQVLTGEGELRLPAMMVKVKTPGYPIQSAGRFDSGSDWQVRYSEKGLVAKAYDDKQSLTGFVVTKDHLPQAFPLLREVSASA